MGRKILSATLVAGTLDILSAFVWTAMAGGDPASVLSSVASGQFGIGIRESSLAPPLGLASGSPPVFSTAWYCGW